MRKTLRLPSGRIRGTEKQETPSSVCARTRKTSHIGALQNHLWPRRTYSAPAPPPPLTGVAVVVLARTSEPPCFSVIAMPAFAEPFSPTGTRRGS